MSQQFRLHTKFKPTGDQPTAISGLVGGLAKGEKFQTLLGVTGSGKSVTANTPVLIKQQGVIQQKEIGPFIDNLFDKYRDKTKKLDNSEYINTSDIPAEGNFETWSFNPRTGENSWRAVTQISRHRVDKILKVKTACGRAVSITNDHNMYVVRNGRLRLVDGNSLQIDDLVPAPRKLPEQSQSLLAIRVLDWLDNRCGLYVTMRLGLSMRDLAEFELPYQKKWAIVNTKERLKVEQYEKIGASELGLAETIGTIKRRANIPLEITLTAELLQMFGYYIAEGHAEKSYTTFTTADNEVARNINIAVKQVGLSLAKRQKVYDYQVNSTVMAQLMKALCGGISRIKRLPPFWTQLSNKQLAEILRAYFAGDGGVDGCQVTCTTASKKLASDLQYALLRFSINARCRRKKILSPGGKQRYFSVISISGRSNLKRFATSIGFSISRKQSKLELLLKENKIENTNCDLAPIAGSDIVKIRNLTHWTQSQLAEKLDVSRSHISFIESDSRRMSYLVAKKLLKALNALQDERVRSIKEDITALLANVYTPIKLISKTDTNELVYDFAVESNETFLAGSGGLFVHNTFTMANIIAQTQKPTLVLAHNKTLAAQLFSEFKQFFPENEVHYFVSYFDYYQPEAYIASSDTYIEKDSRINEEIDRLRHSATAALLTRRDSIIVASVSCIYGIGSPADYGEMSITATAGQKYKQDKFIRHLNDIQYHRNDIDFARGNFRVRGDTIDILPSGRETAYRVEFFDDNIERILEINPLTGEILSQPSTIKIFPTSHYVTPQERLKTAISKIKEEFDERIKYFEKNKKYLEAQRLSQRTKFDLEMLEQTGFVKGIENYSRYLTDREPGEQPATLLDYFPDDFLMFIDESHMTIPQVRGMYNGDRARKEVLVDYGFRLPSALDNRPLTFAEFERHINQVIFVSATPAEYELAHSPTPAEQVIRPTGLLDPKVEVRPSCTQVDDVIAEIRTRTKKHQRVLITTLTKRMAEDLTAFLQELDIKVAYIHSDVDTLERGDILRDLRTGVYDVLVGINLLREGLDLPEVSLVAIIDADKEGFLRSEQSLIQTIGRAARHIDGTVIMYADTVTGSMQRAISETNRRREIQAKYNRDHNITPTSIAKNIDEGLRAIVPLKDAKPKLDLRKIPPEEYQDLIRDLTAKMELAAANLEFERAADLRDTIAEIKNKT